MRKRLEVVVALLLIASAGVLAQPRSAESAFFRDFVARIEPTAPEVAKQALVIASHCEPDYERRRKKARR
jgi:hypothetical protein